MPTFSSTTTLRVNVTDALERVKVHRKWVAFLASERWYKEMRKLFQTASNRRYILGEIRKIVTEEIYDVYEPKVYERTNNLYRSFKVAVLDEILADMAVFSDPTTAPAKLGNDGTRSYGAFFERPQSVSHSFIPDTAEPWRPFAGEIINFLNRFATPAVMKAWVNTAKNKLKQYRQQD
jgi:hypothetical protein